MKSRFKDLTGKIYGKLTVVGFQGFVANRIGLWRCQCECGKISEVRVGNLNNGHTTSCGCNTAVTNKIRGSVIRKNNFGETSLRRVFRYYIANARKRGIDFQISKDFFSVLIVKDCTYCGREPRDYFKRDSDYGKFIYNGIDRLNSSIGYVEGNCVSCCRVCNRAKSDMTMEEWQDYLKRLTAFRSKDEKSR